MKINTHEYDLTGEVWIVTEISQTTKREVLIAVCAFESAAKVFVHVSKAEGFETACRKAVIE